MTMTRVWAFLRLFLLVLLLAAIIDWPIISVAVDGKTSSLKNWIYFTCGALSLHIPMWITIGISFNAYQNPQTKLCVLAINSLALVTAIGGFFMSELLYRFMDLQDVQYLGILIYILIIGSLELFGAMSILFMSMLLYFDAKVGADRSEKYTTIIFSCLICTIVAVCAYFILRIGLGGCPVKLELLISLLGLVLFVLFWMAVVCGTFGAMGEASAEWARAAVIIYSIGYFPFFGFWTIHSLENIYWSMHDPSFNVSFMVFVFYMVIFCTLFPGLATYGMLAIGLVIGVIVLLILLVLRLFCPNYLNSITQPAPPTNNFDDEPLYNLAQPLQITLEEEPFDPKKHNKSFVEEEVCSVCLEGFKAGQPVTYWPICKHVFHKDCLNYWIQKNHTCPICKQIYPNAMPIQGDLDLPFDEEISDYVDEV